ncbi:major facilitator superfamily domain-containing protein [Pelagophyceae sp. CCMP2097]|nr:major facilitator superfamily domain-containing protein [Pelagophyceae sp. CCMP2097]|mmetsp:Transcript_25333/g.90514  ORF Transcript_25333/g.90514 Transcript_25333/m.90514 type:complete len:506 (-) Transcript_25333:49-1566(-)
MRWCALAACLVGASLGLQVRGSPALHKAGRSFLKQDGRRDPAGGASRRRGGAWMAAAVPAGGAAVPAGGTEVFAGGAVTNVPAGGAVAAVKTSSTEYALLASTLLFIISASLVSLSPPPYYVAAFGAERAATFLAGIAASSAALEIVASPIIGGLVDSVGRRPGIVAPPLLICLFHALVAGTTAIPALSAAKFFGGCAFGLYFLSSQAVLADIHKGNAPKIAASSGVLFAIVNLGFAVGVQLSRFLPKDMRYEYGVSAAVAACAVVTALFGVKETLSETDRATNAAAAAAKPKRRLPNPVSFVRLLSNGRRLRLLTILTALQLIPIFMGDVLQLYAIDHWKLGKPQVVQLFSLVGVTGIVSNAFGGLFTRRLGVQGFTALATLGSLGFWVGATVSYQAALLAAVIGFLGPARALCTSAALQQEGARVGMQQGALAGDRANMMAILKVAGPLFYGWLYKAGKGRGVAQLPFLFNCAVTTAALLLGFVAISAVNEDDTTTAPKPAVA